MLAKNFQRMTVSAFLVTLAVSDTVVIVVSTLNKSTIRSLIGTDFRSFDLTGCRVFFWAYRTPKLVSSWIGRFHMHRTPSSPSVSRCDRRPCARSAWRTPVSSARCWARAPTVASGHGWTRQWFREPACPNSTHLKSYITTVEIFLLFSLAVYAIVPAIIMVVLNSVTVTCLWRSRRKVHAQSSVHDPAGKAATQLVRTTAMLLSTNAAFIVFVTPISLAHAVSFFRRQDLFESSDPMLAVFRELTQIFRAAQLLG